MGQACNCFCVFLCIHNQQKPCSQILVQSCKLLASRTKEASQLLLLPISEYLNYKRCQTLQYLYPLSREDLISLEYSTSAYYQYFLINGRQEVILLSIQIVLNANIVLNMNSGVNGNKENYDIAWIQKDTKCWVYQPNQTEGEMYLRGVVKGVIPLFTNKANSKVAGMLEIGSPFECRANQIEKCRESNSLERDLIDMDIINAPEILRQLKRRLSQKKIHTLIWNSLIIVNPFKLIPESYGQKMLAVYFEHIYLKKQDVKKHEPHIYSFVMTILSNIYATSKTQVISISGESGSGKTQTHKEALNAISYVCSRMHQKDKIAPNTPESKIMSCDPILLTFGNAKTIKNDNSSRFGKLVTLVMDGHTLRIHQVILKNYFLEKSRIISQSLNQRNFHIFYLILAYLPDQQKNALRLKSNGRPMRFDDFRFLTNRTTNAIPDDKHMWDQLNQALSTLGFSQELIRQIWSVVAATLLLGNLNFEMMNDDEPCQIKNPEIAESVAYLLGLETSKLVDALTTHRRSIAGEVVVSPLSEKLCNQGRDSVAKAIYESLFNWLVSQLNTRLNQSHSDPSDLKIVKLLDIYGFQVFDHNSFQQLCVNFTNQKIHQIYLEQIFILQKQTLKKEGLQSVIKNLTFTDNIKIIELLETSSKSVFNLLDESCSVNVRDDDFLTTVKKNHDTHEHFPPSNMSNIRKSFIIKHTPGDIEYMIDGFRQKNKDLIREDLLLRLGDIKIKFISQAFRQKYQLLKQEGNKKFLSIKIRKQVRQLILEMSTNTDMHFIRCIKPNEKKHPFHFVDRICYNQIKYLGILDTIQMRKDTYHIRTPYINFYQKYGILENNLGLLIKMSQGKVSPHDSKEITMKFINNLNVHYSLDYQFGKERIFLKMSTQNRLDSLLSKQLHNIQYAATRIKVQFRHFKIAKLRKIIRTNVPMVQRAIKRCMMHIRAQRMKKAVKKIENAWLQYKQVFFARKRLPKLRILEKYIKGRKEQMVMKNKILAVAKAKVLMRGIVQSNMLSRKIKNYRQMKIIVKEDIINNLWRKLKEYYSHRIQKYLRGGLTLYKNSMYIFEAEQTADYRLNIKSRQTIQKYLKTFQTQLNVHTKKSSIIRIQSFFRMKSVRIRFKNLLYNTLLIQRNWRKYYHDKMFNLEYTSNYFKEGLGGKIEMETEHWKQQLFRDLTLIQNVSKVQKLLQNNQRVKMDKIGLFYYLLDFQILADLSHIYPENSWIENYTSLFEQCWQKGNPIQMVDVSDTQTIVSTLNRAYTWGDLHFQDFDQQKPSYRSWKNINSPQLPPGRVQKVHAHNSFSVVEIQNSEPFIIGNEKMYEEDCSAKEWKTFGESYIIINGIVLTLKKVEFSRVVIPEKVVQLSCGMSHCLARTSLRKVYGWGDNSNGQLGVGHFKRVKNPKLLDWFSKQAITIQQTAATAYGSVALDSNSRIFWWGTNGTIQCLPTPKQVYLFEKTNFLDNPQKYTIARVVTSWSKSLSLIGVTVAAHEGIFKSSQNQVKKKTYQNLISKWNQDINTVMPPFVQTISGYFQQRLMPKPKIEPQIKGQKQSQHQRIREKLLSEIMLMEEAERTLLKERKKF